MKKKTIVQIIPTLRTGGGERFVVDLCNHLASLNAYKVYLISLAGNSKGTGSFLTLLSKEVTYLSFEKPPGFSPKVFWQLQKWLFRHKPNVVHSHINAFEYISFYRLFAKRTKFVHTLHTIAKDECPNTIIKNMRQYFYRRNTIPVTISNNGRHSFRAYYKLKNDILIQNGSSQVKPSRKFDETCSQYKSLNEFNIVHIGRIVALKNQKLLIQSIKQFNKQSEKKAKLFLIGRIGEQSVYDELEAIADKQIIFLGERNDIGDFLLFADAFCLSSINEGMPISIIESFSAGCIPISTPVGGIPEMIINGESGFLSKDLSIESYLKCLKDGLFAQNRNEIKANCIKKFHEEYNITTCAQAYEKLYIE